MTCTAETRNRIGAQHNWICPLCDQPIDPNLSVYQSIWAPVIDHIVPRIAGGDGNDENLQVTHYECNRAKGVSGYRGKPRVRRPRTQAEWAMWEKLNTSTK